MSEQADIKKAAGIIIRDRKLLVGRSVGKEHFIAPGGKIEGDETETQALVRELMEEYGITVDEQDLEKLDDYTAPATGQEHRLVKMSVYIVKKFQGDPTPSSEVAEMAWVTSANEDHLPLGSIFEHNVTPRLVADGLID